MVSKTNVQNPNEGAYMETRYFPSISQTIEVIQNSIARPVLGLVRSGLVNFAAAARRLPLPFVDAQLRLLDLLLRGLDFLRE